MFEDDFRRVQKDIELASFACEDDAQDAIVQLCCVCSALAGMLKNVHDSCPSQEIIVTAPPPTE